MIQCITGIDGSVVVTGISRLGTGEVAEPPV